MFKKWICQNRNWVFQNFPFLENDFDALTDYELFCKMVEYAKSLALSNEKFVSELKSDLDTMYNEGKFDSLIMEIVNLQTTFTFDSVADMKSATNLITGKYARTSGFYSYNDGGGAFYKVREKEVDETVNEMSLIELSDETLVAELIRNNVNVKQYGAKGDDNNDDTLSIQTCIDENLIVYIPSGTYQITNSLNITNNGQKIYGEGTTLSNIKKYGINSYDGVIDYDSTSFDYGNHPSIINIIFPEDNNLSQIEIKNIHLTSDTTSGNNGITAPHVSYCKFDAVRMNKCYNGILIGGWINKINNFEILENSDIGINIRDSIYTVVDGVHSNSINVRNGTGIYINNSAFDNGYPCFQANDSKSVFITNCSTETYRQVLRNNNSYVNIYGCDLEGHSSTSQNYFQGFADNTNGGITNITNCNIHYEDYNSIGNPTNTNIITNTSGTVTLKENKITLPYTYTNYIGSNSTLIIDDKIESTIGEVVKKTGIINFSANNNTEILRLPFEYGKNYMLFIKSWGSMQYHEVISLNTTMVACSNGNDSAVSSDVNYTVVKPSDSSYSANLHLVKDGDELVLYFITNISYNSNNVYFDIEYSSN